MKTMKKLLYVLFLVTSFGALTSCEQDDDEKNQPATEDVPLILPKINQENNAFVLGDPSSTYAFRVELDRRGVDVASVEVYKTYAGATVFTPRVLHTTLTTFPSEVSVTLADAVQGFTVPDPENPEAEAPLDVSLVEEGDIIIFTFEVVRTDGRRIVYTPLDASGSITGTQIFEPFAAWANVVAP
jgi:hypothetical protein